MLIVNSTLIRFYIYTVKTVYHLACLSEPTLELRVGISFYSVGSLVVW